MGIGKKLTLTWQSLSGPLGWKPSPVLATKLGSPLSGHATPPHSWGHQRAARALQNDWACPLYYKTTLSWTGILTGAGLRLVGLKRFLLQIGTNLLSQQNCLIARRNYPFLWAALDLPFLQSCLSCWMERGSHLFPPI